MSVDPTHLCTQLILFADMTQEEDQGQPAPAAGTKVEAEIPGEKDEELVALQSKAEEETITAKKEDGFVTEEAVDTPPSVRQLANSMDSVMVSGMLKNISQKVAIIISSSFICKTSETKYFQ